MRRYMAKIKPIAKEREGRAIKDYYTAVIWLCIFALSAVAVSINMSRTLMRQSRVRFILLFTSIALSALCEWIGVMLQNTGPETRTIHILVKMIELSVAPCTSIFFVWIVEPQHARGMMWFLAAHGLLEILSGFFGFIYYVDAYSYYYHAQYYWIYMLAYLVSLCYVFIIIGKSMKTYQYTGYVYTLMILLLILGGIVVQMINSSVRVVYLSLTIASVMIYVFSLEMVQQTDKLSELLNRRGFDTFVQNIDVPSVIIFFDIDRFKSMNDEYGHAFGDKCITTIGRTIKHVYAKNGKCFRYGGDEFCVILQKNLEKTDAMNEQFIREIQEIRVEENRLPIVSFGYAYFDPEDGSFQSAISLADEMMYRQKREHEALDAVLL